MILPLYVVSAFDAAAYSYDAPTSASRSMAYVTAALAITLGVVLFIGSARAFVFLALARIPGVESIYRYDRFFGAKRTQPLYSWLLRDRSVADVRRLVTPTQQVERATRSPPNAAIGDKRRPVSPTHSLSFVSSSSATQGELHAYIIGPNAFVQYNSKGDDVAQFTIKLNRAAVLISDIILA